MDKKVAERTNVLTESENKSFIHAVINAVTKGYSDKTVLEDIVDLIRRKEVSKGVIQAAPEALKTYGESLKNSLDFLSQQIEELEIIDEPTVRKKDKNNDENVVEEEMKKEEEKVTDKKSSLDKFSSLDISEDWDKYCYDEKKNCMTGTLKLNFRKNMNKFRSSNNKVKLEQSDVDDVLSRVYGYFTTEFKNLKAGLSPNIFKTGIKFSSLEKGEAEVEYEIKGAF